MRIRTLLCGLVVLAAVCGASAARTAEEAKKITYDEHIKPIFQAKCFGCHNPDKKVGGLDLTTYTALKVGGASGEVVDAGDAGASYLWGLVNHDSEPHMPPKQEKMPKEILDVIRAWIDGGALESSGSKFVRTKPKFDFALKEAPTGKPAQPPMPGRLRLEPVVKTNLTTATTALATSPWAPLTAVAGQQQVLLYHSQTLELLGVFAYPEGQPHVLNFSRNGSLLLAGGGRGAYQGRVVVWDIKTGQRVFEVGNEVDTVLGADISADQSLIALVSSSKVIRCYSTRDGQLAYEIPKKHTEWIYCAAFSPDGVLLATADRNGGLFVWEADTGRQYLELRGHTAAITGLAWRSDGNILASCSEDTTIRLWEMENGGQVRSWGGHGGGCASIEFTREGQLVSCGRDLVAKLWNQDGAQVRAFPAFSDLALRVSYCDETNRVVAGDWTGLVKVWNAADGADLGALSVNPPKLDERSAAATQLLTANQAQHTQLATAYQAAQGEADKLAADLAAAQKAVVDLQKQLETATNAVKVGKETIATLTAEHDVAAKAAAALEPVVPLLKETVDKALQTAAKAPEDKELAAAVAQLKAVFDKRSAELDAAKKTQAEKAAALEKAKQELVVSEKLVTDTTAALQVAQKRVTDLEAAVKAAGEKAAAAKQAADTGAQAVASAQQQVNRWNGEIVFVQKLNTLDQREEEFQTLLAAATVSQSAFDKATADLATANQALTNAQNQAKTANDAVGTTKPAVDQAAAAQLAVTQLVTALEAALPLLQEALVKSQEAAAKAAGDKELADAAGQLKAIVEKKTAAIPVAKTDLTTKTAALDAAKQQLAVAEKQAVDAANAVATAQKGVADQTAVAKAAEENAGKAKQAADAASQTFAAAQKEVDALRGTAG